MADVENGVTPEASVEKRVTVRFVLRTLFHLVYYLVNHAVLCWGALIVYKIRTTVFKNPEINNLKNFGPAFLTNWNYTFQTLFLSLSLLYDSLEWLNKESSNFATKIKYWKDVLFCSMVLPYTLFVTSMFWTVYAIDRELVFPVIYDEVVPWWFNHCVHTNIVVVIALETLLQARRKPCDEKMEQTLFWGVGTAYAVVYYTIYFATHRWLYQVFGVMTWWQVVLYQIGIWGISYVFYKMQFPINRLIHGQEKEEIGEEKIGEKNGEPGKVITDLKAPPFSTRSWSLKFRNLRNHFETSRL